MPYRNDNRFRRIGHVFLRAGCRGWALLRGGALVVASIALSFGVLIFVAWEFPESWLNESTLAWAARSLEGKETRIVWSRARVAVRKPSFLHRELALELDGFHGRFGGLRWEIASATLNASFRFGWLGPSLRIDALDVDGRTLDMALQDTPPTAENTTPAPLKLPAWLQALDVGRIRIAFDAATITTENWHTRVALRLEARPDGRGIRWDADVRSRTQTDDAGEISADAQVRISSLAGPWFGPYTAKAFVQASEKNFGKATLSIAGTPTVEGTSDFRGSLVATLPSKVRVRSTFSLAVSPEQIRFAPRGRIELPSGPIATVELSACRTTLARPFAGLPDRLRCQGAFRARARNEKWDGQTWRLVASPTHWELVFDELVGVHDASAKLVATLEGDAQQPLGERPIVASLEARIGNYSGLARKLYRGDFSIPQPFASLAGDVRVNADWRGSLSEFSRGATTIPWKATSALWSARQKFFTTSRGIFRLGGDEKNNELEAEVALENVALDLPEMSLAPIRLLPDPRIRSFEPKAPTTKPGFRYRVRVRTPEGQPIRLRSNLAMGPIPIALNVLLTDDAGPRGSVTVLSFPVEFFRRRGELERLQVAFAARGGNPVIDAVFRVRYAEYVITLKAIGPASKPTFEASSEPPLPERDVWAALLFGRKLETDRSSDGASREPTLSSTPQQGSPFASRLSSEEARSAAEMQAAAVDGGLSLATMYLLASTPVESVSYDPISGEVRAAVRLADGAAITVGSDLRSSRSVGFRYRLGNNWYVTTTLEDALDFTNTRLGTRLEWTRRY